MYIYTYMKTQTHNTPTSVGPQKRYSLLGVLLCLASHHEAQNISLGKTTQVTEHNIC